VDFQIVGPSKGLARSSLKILEMVKQVTEKDGFLEDLKKIPDINLRYKKLSEEFLSSFKLANSREVRAFIFQLAKTLGKDGLEIFGICPYLKIELKTETRPFIQFCTKSKKECACAIPQPWCVIRDGKNAPPKYERLYFIF